jgi:hypothetical protein
VAGTNFEVAEERIDEETSGEENDAVVELVADIMAIRVAIVVFLE